MSFEKILEYQKIDIELKRVLAEIEKTDDFKRIEQAKQKFAQEKKAVEESEKSAATLVEAFDDTKGQMDELEKKYKKMQPLIAKIEKLSAKGDDDFSQNDLDELEKAIDQLKSLKYEAVEIEKNILDKKNSAGEIITSYKIANENGKKIKEFHQKAKARYDEFLKQKQPAIDGLNNKLKELSTQIDKALLAQYKAIVSEGKHNAFVGFVVDGKDFSCRGCGIGLSQTAIAELTSKNHCVCESCRRVVCK